MLSCTPAVIGMSETVVGLQPCMALALQVLQDIQQFVGDFNADAHDGSNHGPCSLNWQQQLGQP